MGETTTLSLNNKNKASLKTTIPMFIVKQFNLKAGDEIEWSIEVCSDNELVFVGHKPWERIVRVERRYSPPPSGGTVRQSSSISRKERESGSKK